MNNALLESLRREYPKGARVELVQMNDIQAPPIGTKGTVIGVDDIGSIMVKWDNGSSLNVVYGEDSCKKLNYVIVKNYGQERTFDERQAAIDFYEECVVASEGAERERYLEILFDLNSGKIYCSDKR